MTDLAALYNDAHQRGVRRVSELRRVQDRVQRQIEGVRRALRDRMEKDAAEAFDTMLGDDLARRDVTNALTSFYLDRNDGEKVRQGDVHTVIGDLAAAMQAVNNLESRLARLCLRFDGLPGAPSVNDVTSRGMEACAGVVDLASLADDLHRAIVAEFGPDLGNPMAVSERFAGDPLDHLADALALPWRDMGFALTGRQLSNFMHVLRAVHEAATGAEDISERSQKRIRKRLRNGTRPPPK